MDICSEPVFKRVAMKELVSAMYEHAISNMPSLQPFSDLRYKYYKKRLKYSEPFFNCSGFTIIHPSHVSIGRDCYFNRNVYLSTIPEENSEIIIGRDCIFAPNIVVVASDHPYQDVTTPMGKHAIGGTIIIGDGCWIGSNVTITKDVMIGKESVIGANSVVTHDIPEYSVAAGCPARVIKSRLEL
jgi:acetyltransferase-like isoleucine patch superfamily enzyme